MSGVYNTSYGLVDFSFNLACRSFTRYKIEELIDTSKVNLLVCTSSGKKFSEIMDCLSDFGYNVIHVMMEIPEIQDWSSEVVAAHKLDFAYRVFKNKYKGAINARLYLVVEDTGFAEVNKKYPGALIKYIMDYPGLGSLEGKYIEQATLGICDLRLNTKAILYDYVSGNFLYMKDSSGFGWDPHFTYDTCDTITSQLTKSEKNRHSSRGKCCYLMSKFIDTKQDLMMVYSASTGVILSSKDLGLTENDSDLYKSVYGEEIGERIKSRIQDIRKNGVEIENRRRSVEFDAERRVFKS